MEINIPEVLAEVTEAFADYERALIENDVAALDNYFWNNELTLRYGAGENLYGHAAIAAFRAARPAGNLEREIVRQEIVTFGRDYAVTNIETRRAGSTRIGRQSQTWVRMKEGWRIVSAHVSVMV